MTKLGWLFFFTAAALAVSAGVQKGTASLPSRRATTIVFIPLLIETRCTTSQLCFGQIKVTILISYLSL